MDDASAAPDATPDDLLPSDEDEAVLAAAEERALADARAGRVVSHEAVMRWLESLTTDTPLPRPQWGE